MNKRKISIGLFAILIIGIIIMFLLPQNDNVQEIEMTQLSSQTNDRMMGYVIRTNEGKTIVIDGGMDTDADNLLKHIKKYNNNKVDCWILTHPHRDHVGAFIEIIQNNRDIDIEKIYYSANDMEWYNTYAPDRANEVQKFYDALENEKVQTIKKEPEVGEIIQVGNINIEVLGINNPEITENPINNSSMVFKIYVNEKSILFLADAGEECSRKLEAKYGNNLKSDIVQMAHHGQGGTTEELYKLVNPEICLWPTPEWLWNNDSGAGYNTGPWTTLETRLWMEKIGVTTNYIAKDGDIVITIK